MFRVFPNSYALAPQDLHLAILHCRTFVASGLEVVEGAKGLVDGLCQLVRRCTALAGGCHLLELREPSRFRHVSRVRLQRAATGASGFSHRQ